MDSIEASAIHLAQEIALDTDGDRDELMTHLNRRFLPGELRTLAQAARILAESADGADGTDDPW